MAARTGCPPVAVCCHRLLFTGLLLCACFIISSFISVARKDARTLAERRIHSADVLQLSGRMFGGCLDRSLILQRSEARRRPRQTIKWCKELVMKAAPGPVTALASFPGSGNTWLRYLLQQATGIAQSCKYASTFLQSKLDFSNLPTYFRETQFIMECI